MVAVAVNRWNEMEQVPGRVAVATLVGRVQSCLDWLAGFSRDLTPCPASFGEVVLEQEEAEESAMQQTIFCYGASVLALRLMRADGTPNSKERTSFLALFTLAGMSRGKLSSLLAAAAKDEAPTLQYARQINGLLGEEEELRREFMLRLARLALSDAPLDVAEYRVLCDIGKVFGLAQTSVARLVMEADGPLTGTPEALLRVQPGATEAEMQAAYHERLLHCHPDRWRGGEEFQEIYRLATLKSAAVNEAYETLTRTGKKRRK